MSVSDEPKTATEI